MAGPLRVPVLSLEPGELMLLDEASRYVARVHRLRAGDTFVAFDPDARTEADVVVLATGRRVRCRVGAVRASRAVTATGLTLIQALGKGDKPERVIRDATALGVERVVLVETERTVPRRGVARTRSGGRTTSDAWVDRGSRRDARHSRLHAVAVESARQCGRGDVPAIDGPMSFAEGLATVAPGALRLCLLPDAARPLGAVLGPEGERAVTLLIGPEGGLAPGEVQAATAAGFVPVSLFDFVLRTETAAVAALSAVLAIRRSPGRR